MAGVVDKDEWAAQWAVRVGRRVASLRRRAGISSYELAARLATLGHPLPRSVIANLENRRRSVITVPDLLALAAALDVPPAALLLPADPGDTVPLTPNADARPSDALGWFTGANRLPDDARAPAGDRVARRAPRDLFAEVSAELAWLSLHARLLDQLIEQGQFALSLRPVTVGTLGGGTGTARTSRGGAARAAYRGAIAQFLTTWHTWTAIPSPPADDATRTRLRDAYGQLFTDAPGLDLDSATWDPRPLHSAPSTSPTPRRPARRAAIDR